MADFPPLIPKGACQTIEDATELANALQSYFSEQDQQAKTIKECDEVGRMARPEPWTIEQTLRKYSAKREQRAKALVSFSSNYAKVHTANLPYSLGPMVRKLIYAYLPEWGWMWGLKWLYGYQPTVEHVSGSQVHAFCWIRKKRSRGWKEL